MGLDKLEQENKKLKRLIKKAQIGWWEADFNRQVLICSEFMCELLHLNDSVISFMDFLALVREDFQARILNEFTAIRQKDDYEQTFPVNTPDGIVWVTSQLAFKEYEGNGTLIGTGYLQHVKEPELDTEEAHVQRINNLIYQQNSISLSLLSFLQTEDIWDATNQILKDILMQFNGGRAYIFEFDWEKRTQSCTYEVTNKGVSEQLNKYQNLPMDKTPWLIGHIGASTPLLINSLDELPPEAEAEKEVLERQDIKSAMIVPLIAHDAVWGYAGINIIGKYRTWENEDYQWFSSLSNIVSICMELHKSETKAQKDRDHLIEAHQALNKSEKLLRNIYKSIPVGIELYDTEGLLVDVNDKETEIFGLSSKNDAIGLNLFENPNIPDYVKEKLRKQESVEFNIIYDFSKLGDYYTSREKGKIDLQTRAVCLYGADGAFENYLFINIDNTEKTSAFSKIREFEEFFSVIANFASLGYFKWNPVTKEGFAIDQWLKNLNEEGNSVKDVAGFYQKVHPEDRPGLLQFYEDVVTGRRRHLNEEVRVLLDNEELRWLRSFITVKEYNPENKNIELIGVNYDITELKETQSKLIIAKEKAEELDRLKSAFLANMSHEIRTPLNSIVGFSSLLVESNDVEERKEFLSIMQENTDLLLQLISDILDLSKIEAGTFDFTYTDVEAGALCTEIVRTYDMKMPAGVALLLEGDANEYVLCSDKLRIMQILTNFLNNAIKFTPSGSITLGYRLTESSSIEFYVQDTGCGISEENRDTVFERFVKLNNFVAGTGLGLPICKSIVEQLHGTIGVDSQVGVGSRFWITLPYTSQGCE